MPLPSKHYVFYADDDPDDLQLVREAFSRYSNNVELITASDGAQALSFFENLAPDEPEPCLVIFDINMPGIDGKNLLMKIRQLDRFADMPVVLFTTSTQPLDIIFAKKYKAGFVTKPLNLKHMETITDQFIDHCTEDIRKKIRRTSM